MWIEMHSLMLLAAALLPWEQSLSWWVDLGTNCASHLDAKSPEVDWWLRDTRPAFYIQQLKAMERRMAGQVVVGVLDGRCEAGQGHRRYVHDIFPSQGLSEMSALDSCHQSVRAFLDTGGLSQKMTGEVFLMTWFLFFSFADWEQFTKTT